MFSKTKTFFVKSLQTVSLKVYKRETFVGSDFELFTIFAFNMLKNLFKNLSFVRKQIFLAIIQEDTKISELSLNSVCAELRFAYSEYKLNSLEK